MLNIVVPMAGEGKRFVDAGYLTPKPLIAIMGIPMIRLVINNLRPERPHRFIFICQSTHVEKHDLNRFLKEWAPGCEIVTVDGLTEGAACSVLAARKFIANDNPLMIANSDQWVDTSINEYLRRLDASSLDGSIMTMTANDPKWSFVALDSFECVTRVVEKQVISDEATVGIYNFKRGFEFVASAENMIFQNQRVNGEFYVAPVFNMLIKDGRRIGIFNIGSEGSGMYGLGTPRDLEQFVRLPICKLAVRGLNA